MRLIILLFIAFGTGYCADFTTYVSVSNIYYSQSTIGQLAADAQGNTWVTGSNAFVAKLDQAGNIAFKTTFAENGPYGQPYSYGFAITLDPSGNVWVGGQTEALNFPLVNPLQSSGIYASGSAFLVKMAPDGTTLYSSYFGGKLGNSAINSIATDQNGNLYVTGWTDSSDFPITGGLPATPVDPNSPTYGIFVAKLDPTGQHLLYSTVLAPNGPCGFCFAGMAKAQGSGIAVDAAGDAFVAGASDTALPAINGIAGPFVFKINAAGTSVDYFTPLPGSTTFGARPLAVDSTGNAYIANYAGSDFPATPGAYMTTYDGTHGQIEACAMKLAPSGAIAWATFLGGQLTNNLSPTAAINLDASNNIWLTGVIGNASDPNAAFVAELSADGAKLLYSVEFPAPGTTQYAAVDSSLAAQDIAVDSSGVVHVAGPLGLVSTMTPPLSLSNRPLSIVNAGSDRFSGTVAPGEIISLFGAGLGPSTPVAAAPQSGLFPTSLGDVQVLVNGAPIPLLFVSQSQINAEIPSPLNGIESGLADIRVVNNSLALPDFRIDVADSAFGAFFSGGGYLAAINQDGTVNSFSNPAKAGTYISIWGTGLGSVAGLTMDGAISTAANNYCSECQVHFASYTLQTAAPVQYAGLAPGLIDGVMQINVKLPDQLNAAQSPASALQISLGPSAKAFPQFLGFIWVSQ